MFTVFMAIAYTWYGMCFSTFVLFEGSKGNSASQFEVLSMGAVSFVVYALMSKQCDTRQAVSLSFLWLNCSGMLLDVRQC